MSEKSPDASKTKLFLAKESRRRELATLPIEQKIEILVKLQHIASNVGRQVGRPYQKPWDIKV
jgi:hypothetical protein